jgi:hypothetical protein
MRSYHSPEPIILSVGEEQEVSIADVARLVARKFFCLLLYRNMNVNMGREMLLSVVEILL